MKSIRFYLIIVLLSTICLVNFIAALHGYRKSMAEADKLLEIQLMDSAKLLASLEFVDHKAPHDIDPHTILFQIWHKGQLLKRSNNAPPKLMLPLQPGFHMSNWQGLRWRVLVYNTGENNSWVIVGQRADVYAKLVEGIIIESILPIIWVLPILGLLIWLIVSFGLRPLQQLAHLLEQREADDLDPLKEEGYPGELAALVASTNSLLTRLANAFERERRFAADAAHELRTPLAVLKITLHNITEEAELTNSNLQELRASVDRMGHSIEQILALYRLTPDKFQATLKQVDISALARQSIAELYPKCQEKNQQIALEAEPLKIDCDPFAISTLLRNLIDNACKYTPAGGTIVLNVNSQQDHLLICVEDSGPGIPGAYQHRVFDRFYRLGGDQHRSNVNGCGLGLSIVDHIVRLHHGKIELGQSQHLGGLSVRILLPLQQESGARLINA